MRGCPAPGSDCHRAGRTPPWWMPFRAVTFERLVELAGMSRSAVQVWVG
ncbi:hypothetical protein Ae717Ps2_5933 [Pseudonocardia sp. Ae717_Ps2]|nr:hypothetical protein Ae717Ps2_5888 [Pseudonocardia sp. Ae717_Ps2]OLM29009.1 hypothetical protein Ae717Ps2_5933 [Pseudonocardia sp. Ae717_Ps2]